MHRLLFPLNDTVVVALPTSDAHIPTHVAQVTVKAERPERVETITTYYLVRHDLSELILKVIMTHLEDALPQVLVFEDLRYTLRAGKPHCNHENAPISTAFPQSQNECIGPSVRRSAFNGEMNVWRRVQTSGRSHSPPSRIGQGPTARWVACIPLRCVTSRMCLAY
ncbi:hypothetical protein C8Q74DRAFT_201382 [Fomes fomentarius]|nr:hypothetical protein C8Q74DRAFT_201382 [Fomes fomentarius]